MVFWGAVLWFRSHANREKMSSAKMSVRAMCCERKCFIVGYSFRDAKILKKNKIYKLCGGNVVFLG